MHGDYMCSKSPALCNNRGKADKDNAEMSGQEPRFELPPFDQIGIVVEDIDRAIEFYTSVFGFGPFAVREVELDDVIYRGRSCYCRQRNAFAQLGPIQIELIQPLEGESPHADFLMKNGEGLEHLRFQVDNLNDMLVELGRRGIEPIYRKSFPHYGMAFAYVDSDKVGGVLFELMQRTTHDLPR